MRMGKYWSIENIDNGTRIRINKIIDGEYDENIRERVRQKAINLTDITHFRALPLWFSLLSCLRSSLRSQGYS